MKLTVTLDMLVDVVDVTADADGDQDLYEAAQTRAVDGLYKFLQNNPQLLLERSDFGEPEYGDDRDRPTRIYSNGEEALTDPAGLDWDH